MRAFNLIICAALLSPAEVSGQTQPTARLYVETAPPGATVLVDGSVSANGGELIDQLPAGRELKLQVSHPGFHDYIAVITLDPDKINKIDIALRRQTVRLDVVTEPTGAYVLIDEVIVVDTMGEPLSTPCTITNAPVGIHDIVVVKREYRDLHQRRTQLTDGLLISVKLRRGVSKILKRALHQYPTMLSEPPIQIGEEANQLTSSTWVSLFDGKTLDGWIHPQDAYFTGMKATVKNARIVMEKGSPFAGLLHEKSPPPANYELAFEVMVVQGTAGLVGILFPVMGIEGDSVTWRVGAGGKSRLSLFDGRAPSENGTSRAFWPLAGEWYRIRLRVLEGRIDGWINDERVIELDTGGYATAVERFFQPLKPFGIWTEADVTVIRNIRIRKSSRQ